MAKNTIGQFISALRKANGMTQKQLAEKLNVSDKAVSRWERDECAPDLSLIPVIADIFGVTSDEILRGERNTQYSDVSNNKSEKQIKRLIDGAQTKFTVRSIISIGIGLVGLLAAMICNYGFLRANIGFFIGSVFYLVAVICEVIFTKLAFFSIENDDFEDNNFILCKKHFFRISALTCSIILILFSVTLPLVVFTDGPYMGLLIGTWAKFGLLFGVVGALVSAVLFKISEIIAVNMNLYNYAQEMTSEVLKLRKHCIIVLSVIIAVTFFVQGAFILVPKKMLTGCLVYTDVNKFVEYIETPSDIPANEVTMPLPNPDYDTITVVEDDSLDKAVISEDEEVKYIYSEDGNTVICSYVHRNKDVNMIEVEWNDGVPTILAFTNYNIQEADRNFITINIVLAVAYIVEIVVVGIVYYGKKRNLLSK